MAAATYEEQVAAVKAGAQACPKCGLEAKTLLYRFCTHAVCPVRDALKRGGRMVPDDNYDGGEP